MKLRYRLRDWAADRFPGVDYSPSIIPPRPLTFAKARPPLAVAFLGWIIAFVAIPIGLLGLGAAALVLWAIFTA